MSTPAPYSLPDEVRYGFVTGKTLLAVGDTTDDEDSLPDGVAATGTIQFAPLAAILRTVTDPATIIKKPIVTMIHQGKDQPDDPDPEKAGLLIDPAGRVGVVALVTGQYTVTYDLEGATVPPFAIEVTTEHTEASPLDLTLAAPLIPSPTVKFVVNEQVYADTITARDEAVAARDEVMADTGRRDVRGLIKAPYAAPDVCELRRTHRGVELIVDTLDLVAGEPFLDVPAGFQPPQTRRFNVLSTLAGLARGATISVSDTVSPEVGGSLRTILRWTTDQPWPATLPGTAL